MSEPKNQNPIKRIAAKRLTAKQRRVKKAVEYLQTYIATYSKQACYLDYSDTTIIDDVLYALGVALGKEKYMFAGGYANFKQVLLVHLESPEKGLPPVRKTVSKNRGRL